MSLEEVGRVWESWAEIAADDELVSDLSEDRESRPEGAVKPLYASCGWVPFAGDIQHHVALDFDPGPKGRTGQVINCGRDDEVLHAIAGTFADFLEFVARQFVLGRVGLAEGDDEEERRWLKVAGSKRDLLTGLADLLRLDAEGPAA